ncbi:MAG: iron export ABC transporter permease subunit FetB [Acidimicrobiales bacterium]|nr:iron export ABC transporter permease subunit FetB [Acidimicrobiales bacterium]
MNELADIALADIGLDGLAISGILIAVALVLSVVRRLGLEKDLLVAAARALVQLLIVGFALRIVVDGDDPLIFTWIWVVLMVVVAAWTVRRRAPEVPNVIPLALLSFAAAAAVTLGVLFGLRVFEPTGRAIVPIAGMMVGNSMTATVVVSRRLVAEVRDYRDLIEARLALGLSSHDAFAPHLREALRTGLVPQIETTKTVGLIALPGAMTGLILAGVEPIEAVRVQVAVMYLVLGSVSTTAAVMALGLTRRLFTKDHRLVLVEKAASQP